MTTPQKQRRRQQITIGLLAFIASAVTFLIVYQIAFVNPRYDKVLSAECAHRADLQAQVDSTEKFLAHPQQLPQFDDPHTLSLIRAQLSTQQQTLATLAVLPCG